MPIKPIKPPHRDATPQPLLFEAPVPMAELQQLFTLFNARRYADMEARALSLTQRCPSDGQSWKALGIARQVQGKDALSALQRAMTLLPQDAELPSNLGGLLNEGGQFDRAAECFRLALALQPGFAAAHSNLGLALLGLGQFEAAAASCRQALALQPDMAVAHNNLGNALMALGQLGDALSSYQAAIRHNPRLAQAHHSLGNAQRQQGDLGAAGQSLRRAVDINPSYAAAHNSLALLLQAGGQTQAAAESFERAIILQPDFAEAHFHLGKLLSEASQAEAAVTHYQLALRIKPDFAEAHSNLGNALKAIGRWDDALASYAQALQLKADFPQAQRNLAQALKEVGRLDEAAALLRRAIELEPLDLSTRSDMLFLRNLQPALEATTSAAQRLAEAREFGALATQRVPQAQAFTHWPNSPDPKRCLRVGWVSADLRQHPVGYFTQSVIASMAALAGPAGAAVELFVYSNHPDPKPDRISAQIAAHCKTWTPVKGMTDAQLAAQVRSDGIDVLIDLSGHTGGNRLALFACKPAPLQLSWLGYCASTGLAAMDYFIADRWIAPPAAESEFTERLLRLPETFLCFTPPEVDLAVSALPASTRGAVTFGCFNNLAKLNDAVLALWAQILLALPSSRLFLKAAPLADPVIAAALLKRFAALGVGAERLLLEGQQARADYLAAYHRVDIALDPFPYPGGTTSVEALWMGVPVLSFQAGGSALARQGESILQNCGLADWLARDEQDYLRLALSHAADLPALAALRQRLRQQLLDSPLCDAPRFARHLEAALREAWVAWCAGRTATS